MPLGYRRGGRRSGDDERQQLAISDSAESNPVAAARLCSRSERSSYRAG
jgi:hypothetical protein